MTTSLPLLRKLHIETKHSGTWSDLSCTHASTHTIAIVIDDLLVLGSLKIRPTPIIIYSMHTWHVQRGQVLYCDPGNDSKFNIEMSVKLTVKNYQWLLTGDIAQAWWFSLYPHNGSTLQPKCDEAPACQQWRALGEDKVPQLPQPIPTVCDEVAVENPLLEDDGECIAANVDLAGATLLVDDVAQLSETLLLLKEKEGLNFDSIHLLIYSLT